VHKSAIGARLREERERLAMSQTQFAGLGEASKRAQINYEQGDSTPDASYLLAISKVGADVQYIVTGVRSAQSLQRDELDLLEGYRAMDAVTKNRTLGFVLAGDGAPLQKGGVVQTIHSSSGQVAGRNIVNNPKK
jgi:transcriptional regulator with XRE-family HTH domain